MLGQLASGDAVEKQTADGRFYARGPTLVTGKNIVFNRQTNNTGSLDVLNIAVLG